MAHYEYSLFVFVWASFDHSFPYSQSNFCFYWIQIISTIYVTIFNSWMNEEIKIYMHNIT